MKFNYTHEKNIFDREHEKMHKEYIEAGMSEEDYRKIYEWDWQLFKEERIYRMHTVNFEDITFDDTEDSEEECNNPLMKRYMDVFSVDSVFDSEEWLDLNNPIDQKLVRKVIRSMTNQQRMILRLWIIDELTPELIALRMGISRRAVRVQIERIRNAFKKIQK